VMLGLIVHSLFYSGFVEDPITWLVLAIAASRLAVAPEGERQPAPVRSRRPDLVPAS
jgi:hypothetical protein